MSEARDESFEDAAGLGKPKHIRIAIRRCHEHAAHAFLHLVKVIVQGHRHNLPKHALEILHPNSRALTYLRMRYCARHVNGSLSTTFFRLHWQFSNCQKWDAEAVPALQTRKGFNLGHVQTILQNFASLTNVTI